MKSFCALTLLSFFCFSCSNINLTQPLSNNGSDPLASPLSNLKNSKKQNLTSDAPSVNFTPGTWVETAMPDAGFFRKYPRFGGRPDRNLQVSSQAKIISYRGSYAKVELDTGDVGYVPSLMLIEKGDESDDYYSPESSPKKRIPIVSSSDPAPPSEDEILKKIRERENQEPTIEVPASNDFVAPEPEIMGVTKPTGGDDSSTQISPPTPTIPSNIPEITPIDDSSLPPKPVIAPAITPPTSSKIQIDKPVDTTNTSISAPFGDKINQDAALELRITEPFIR